MNEASVIPSASHRRTNDKAFELISACLRDGVKILDLGAGRGHLARRVAQQLTKSGYDFTQHLVAADLFEDDFQAREVPFQKADFNERLPFADGSFDVVYTIEVVEHMQNAYAFLKEIHRLLKPGGKLILSTPNTNHLVSRFKALCTGYPTLFEPPSIDPKNVGRICGHVQPLHYAYYDYGLRLAGFGDVQLYCDKTKSVSVALYYLLWPLLKLSGALHDWHIKKYDAAVYAESRRSQAALQSKLLLTSRSLMFVAVKAG